ncbi:uncharacterized protein BDZ83DRAFT_621471 [Colletotrichum acutatum]|uniref:Uncharacterized protein n=1 Tax=Glomerella acutata TaxID=27357 RepID=A0AAD8UPJ8_GLOAC|nr:uncharacterized protein BDZ83DRAFT_621471 [Colletotrichum acutatum]KAK1724839.1 hypothetical protein BDZ83DRAFT_621471 [Colletotrichum acutatum]
MANIVAHFSDGCYQVYSDTLSAAVSLRSPRRNNPNLAQSLRQTPRAVSLIEVSVLIASLIHRFYPKLDQETVS